MPDCQLAEKVVVVAGACGLLGRGIVRSIVQRGGIGIIADIDRDAGSALKRQLEAELESRNVDFIPVDITSKSSLQNSIRAARDAHGRIDALVNTAYPRTADYGRPLFEVEYKDFCENVNLHLGGYFLASQQYAAFFKDQGWGGIVNIASIYGVMAPRFHLYDNTRMTMPVEYAAIKSAIIHLTRYMAQYCKPWNVRVNCISPGGILADQEPSFLEQYRRYCGQKGMLEPVDVVGSVVFLLSDDARYVTGQNIIVDDGFSL